MNTQIIVSEPFFIMTQQALTALMPYSRSVIALFLSGRRASAHRLQSGQRCNDESTKQQAAFRLPVIDFDMNK